MKLSNTQQIAFDKATEGRNLLILGKAGVGKSFLTNKIISHLQEEGKVGVVAAPTAVAALHVGGVTIHRLLQIIKRGRINKLDYIVIDEISMVPNHMFDKLAFSIQSYFSSLDPFAGAQVILVGDIAQLPPIMPNKDKDPVLWRDCQENYFTKYFFSSNSYCQMLDSIEVVELTEIFRSKDDRLLTVLNAIRDRKDPETWASKLNTYKCLKGRPAKGIVLCARNKDAEEINRNKIAMLKGEERTYCGKVSGESDTPDKNLPVPTSLTLKVGAKVMVVKNIYANFLDETPEVINGDVGEVVELGVNSVRVFIDRTFEEVEIKKALWNNTITVEKEDKETGEKTREVVTLNSYEQLPIVPGYAITIHKSQGATLEEFSIHIGYRLWEAGQLYVALSRGVNLENIWLVKPITAADIKIDPAVTAFLKDHRSGVGVKPGSVWDLELDEEIFDE